MKYAVGLLRQSTKEQVSLDEQERLYMEYVKANNLTSLACWRVVGGTSDEQITRFFDSMRSSGVRAYDELETLWNRHGFDVLWALDATRIGRAKWLYNYIIERTVLSGAVVHLHNGGVIDPKNFDHMVAITAIGSKADVERLHGERAQATYYRKARRGIPPLKVPWTHEKVYKGRELIGARVKPESRPAIDFITRLLLDGAGYMTIEAELLKSGLNDVIWTADVVWRTLWHPMSHGHIMYKGYRQTGLWRLSDQHPIPAGVKIAYNVTEALWDSRTHRQVIDNLISRMDDVNSHAARGTRNAFKGIVFCAGCGGPIGYEHDKRTDNAYLHCFHRCGAKYTRYDVMVDWMSTQLRAAIRLGVLHFEDEFDRVGEWQRGIVNYQDAIEKQEGIIQNLYLDRARSTTPYLFDAIIEQEEKKLIHFQGQLRDHKQQKPVNPRVQMDALENIADIGVTNLWTLPRREVNGILKAVLGGTVFYIEGNRVEIRS